jgi:hypothetical protein
MGVICGRRLPGGLARFRATTPKGVPLFVPTAVSSGSIGSGDCETRCGCTIFPVTSCSPVVDFKGLTALRRARSAGNFINKRGSVDGRADQQRRNP